MQSKIMVLLFVITASPCFAVEALRIDDIAPMVEKDGTWSSYQAADYDDRIAFLDETISSLNRIEGGRDSLFLRTTLVVKGLVERCKAKAMPTCPLYMPQGASASLTKIGDNVVATAQHVVDGLIQVGALKHDGAQYWMQSAAIFSVDPSSNTLKLARLFVPASDDDSSGQTAQVFIKTGRASGVKMFEKTKLELTDFALIAFDQEAAKREVSGLVLGQPYANEMINLVTPTIAVSRPPQHKLVAVDSAGTNGSIPGFKYVLAFQQDTKKLEGIGANSGAPFVDKEGHFLGILVGLDPTTGYTVGLAFDPQELAQNW